MLDCPQFSRNLNIPVSYSGTTNVRAVENEMALFCFLSQIQKIRRVAPKDCRRAHVTQFHDSKIKFPLIRRHKRPATLAPFTTRRPRVKFLQ